jgi:hypothetical protein
MPRGREDGGEDDQDAQTIYDFEIDYSDLE